MAGFYAEERASRGEVIITQKEAKGEYDNVTWLWNHSTTNGMPAEYGNQELEPHVFDNANISDIPARMKSYINYDNSSYCSTDYILSQGDILTGGGRYVDQISCRPNTLNVGNYYDWSASIASNMVDLTNDFNVNGYEAPDSICPRGWQLPVGVDVDTPKSSHNLIYSYTSTLTPGTIMFEGPFSAILSGRYNYDSPSPLNRSNTFYTQTSTVSGSTRSYQLAATEKNLYPNLNFYRGAGFSVRCVAR